MRIGLVAGEASGDHLGAELIKAIRDRIPGARFEGVAGPEMRAWVFRRQYPQFSERERRQLRQPLSGQRAHQHHVPVVFEGSPLFLV